MNPVMRPTNPNQDIQLVQDMMIDHPFRDGYSVVWNGPVRLDVGLPFGGGFAPFEIARFPRNTWVGLQDQSGQQLPLAIYIQGGSITVRWL
jgi:hypothetical protein